MKRDKTKKYLTREMAQDEKFLETCCERGITFGVDPDDIVRMTIPYPGEFLHRDGEAALYGYPCLDMDDQGHFILSSCFGFRAGEENELVCKAVWMDRGDYYDIIDDADPMGAGNEPKVWP